MKANDTKANVLIVDDHEIIREGLEVTLMKLDYVSTVSKAGSSEEALEALQLNTSIHVVITDINMPGLNGIELSRKIKCISRDIKIIVLSQHKEIWILKDLLKLNVDGILLKEDNTSEIDKALREVLNNKVYYSSDIQRFLINNLAGKKTQNDELSITLTRREKEVLKLIADENTNTEIATKLFISNKTVDCHRNNILFKFGARNTAGLIKKAIQYGLIE